MESSDADAWYPPERVCGCGWESDDAVGRVEAHKLKVCGTKSLLADFDDFGGCFVSGISEFGEVVSSDVRVPKRGLRLLLP